MDNVNIIFFVNIHYVFLEQGPNNVGQLQSNYLVKKVLL